MLTSLTCNSVCKRIVKQKPPDTVSCPFHITEVETGDWSIFFSKDVLSCATYNFNVRISKPHSNI